MLNLLNKLIPYYMSLDLINIIPGRDFLQYEIRVYVQQGTFLNTTTSAGSIVQYNGSIPVTYWFSKK